MAYKRKLKSVPCGAGAAEDASVTVTNQQCLRTLDSTQPPPAAANGLYERVDEALSSLSDFEREIVCSAFGLEGRHPQNTDELADRFGIQETDVAETLNKALIALRRTRCPN